ncbi:EpsG family protein [Flavobacterium xueshanense]|nr:EpsG family protein [Flavobacterium xueshanense]
MFFIFGYVFFSRYCWNKNSMGSLCVPLIVSVLFAGLRGNVGTDTFAYKTYFNSIGDTSEIISKGLVFAFEPGFILYATIIRFIINSDQFFIFSLSCLYGILLYKILQKIEEKDLFFLFYISAFYIMFNLNLLRFGISLLFIGNAYLMMLKEDKKYIYLLVLGISFHYAGVLAIMFFIKRKDFIKYFVVLFVFIGIAYAFIITKINSYFIDLLSLTGSFKFDFGLILEFLIVVALCLFNRRLQSKKNILFFFIYYLFRWFSYLFDMLNRFSYVLGFVLFLFLFTKIFKEKSKALIIILILFNLYRTLSFINNSDAAMTSLIDDESGFAGLFSQTAWLPYKFFWQ